jgi:LmbE family N-acetylglucosaminyl deacetylase
MIFHIWPLAGMVLVVQAMKKRAQKEEQDCEENVTDYALTLLAIFAHPDDETFRPGGTLALLARRGVRVEVLTFTHGEAGSCGDPPLCTPTELPAVRERELRSACAALGLQPPRLLDYADGHLHEANAETMIDHILLVMQEIQPQVLLSFGPDGLSGHPDHIAIGQWTAEAFRRAEGIAALYTIAVPRSLAETLNMRQVHPVPDEEIALSVDVSSVWETKLAAMRCHATQLGSSPMMSAPVERQRLFFGREYFVRAAARPSTGDFMPEIFSDITHRPAGSL